MIACDGLLETNRACRRHEFNGSHSGDEWLTQRRRLRLRQSPAQTAVFVFQTFGLEVAAFFLILTRE
jgi:hypothetical protein